MNTMTTVNKKKTRRSLIRMFTVLALTLATLVGSCMPALAANVCENRSGSSNETTSFTVETKGWIFGGSIKFEQTKGVAETSTFFSYGDEKTMYGRFQITYSYTDSKGTHTETKMFTGRTCTINLKKNQTYKITVTPKTKGWTIIHSWTKPAYWSAVKTRNVTYCS